MVDIRKFELPIRVTENKYVRSSLEDTVHFGNIEGYKNIEDQGIGDVDEGKLVGFLKKEKSQISIKIPKSNKEIMLTGRDLTQDPKIASELKDEIKGKIGVASFGLLTFDDLELSKSSDNRKYLKLKKETLNDLKHLIEEKEELTSNKCSLIIFSNPDFFSAIKKSGYEAGRVKYYDPYDLSQFNKLREGKKAYCYLKKDYFKYQREYRIVRISKEKFPEKGENTIIKGISRRASVFSFDQFKDLQLVADFNVKQDKL